ncbi:glutamine amidotransferase-related protein [Pseudomonas typographi]|uniref:CTP synthase (glutamine hydrolyzing) n=1 Tax=Pseudomonas typographi TaxID=2715964 RepID=A0ABR7Z1N4_9PSED|nr:antibiotic biosynthesis monooxygenase [Pseudomonas typographi]MBD1551759.1 hypothetical protein [Pseudomonas typographi]MBD1586986.1 hypothetical protein [Pseudomonas typographi]MBD1599226.1 hypothetical protein [Pseudomonas typographi]
MYERLPLRIGLVGDYSPDIAAHRAIPLALDGAAAVLGVAVAMTWLPTTELRDIPAASFDALWVTPGSPYRDTDAVLAIIGQARTEGIPLLGTCAGFQHGVLEFARSVLGQADAAHGEIHPHAANPVITPLACALIEQRLPLRLAPGSHCAGAHASLSVEGRFRCHYEMAPGFEAQLAGTGLQPIAWDADGQVRGLELAGHPFYVLALFQPERTALDGHVPPLAVALLRAAQHRALPRPMLAPTPAVPYYAVVFSSLRTPVEQGYAAMATRMLALAAGQAGFLGAESARGDDGLGITVSYWESLQAIAAWREHAEHSGARHLGKAQWYARFNVRVARVERTQQWPPQPV